MKARITIEYDLPEGDRTTHREREERRWMTCETLRQLRSATVKVEFDDEGPLYAVLEVPEHKCAESSNYNQ
jgi:hypothetical protein